MDLDHDPVVYRAHRSGSAGLAWRSVVDDFNIHLLLLDDSLPVVARPAKTLHIQIPFGQLSSDAFHYGFSSFQQKSAPAQEVLGVSQPCLPPPAPGAH